MKQKSKDRAYITASEWASEWGGAKDRGSLPFSRLPFHCCGLTFTPFSDPVCADDGTCFDIVNIVPYVRKHKRHPVTGAPLELKDLTQLTFHKNAGGEYHCPVLNKARASGSMHAGLCAGARASRAHAVWPRVGLVRKKCVARAAVRRLATR
jgi:hypothetical protein